MSTTMTAVETTAAREISVERDPAGERLERWSEPTELCGTGPTPTFCSASGGGEDLGRARGPGPTPWNDSVEHCERGGPGASW